MQSLCIIEVNYLILNVMYILSRLHICYIQVHFIGDISHMPLCAYACGGQRLTSSINLHESSILFSETSLLPGTCPESPRHLPILLPSEHWDCQEMLPNLAFNISSRDQIQDLRLVGHRFINRRLPRPSYLSLNYKEINLNIIK